MKPHQTRVVDEKTELDVKKSKLSLFFATELFESLDSEEKDRLQRQYKHMAGYSLVLGERILAFS